FEYAWKSVLVPSFKTPFSYLFYSIKNAKLAKEGQVEIAEVGIKALDERTLRVEFEFPTPYFLELAANPLYSPINRAIDQSCPDWAIRSGDSYICNGPFHLVERDSFNRYILNRNPLYWDVNNVQLDQLILHKVTSSEALEMFNADEGHWESRSTRSLKTFFTEKGLEQVYCHPFSRVFWLSFNCSRFPFRHAKLRKAFACAINRKDIVEILPEGIIPAKTPLPFQHSFYQEVENYEENGANARILFEEALREIGLTKNHFPPLILSCTASAFREKLMGMIKRQWQQVLGVYCRIESLSWQTFFEKMTQGDYQIGGITWGPLIDDPIYTLDVFKSSKEPVNFSKWQNVDYRSILDGAQQELDPKLRNYHLARAERILMEEVPIVPIYYEKENFIQKFHLVEADKESPSKPLAIYLQE
ncbi:MAG: peptide ABC transporter substrate-binding protein, partial [Anaerolineae bacterium]